VKYQVFLLLGLTNAAQLEHKHRHHKNRKHKA
jgi:hypothetical protein